IWDVTDPTGKRVHRITGEELAGKTDSRDPWTAVTPEVMQAITNKTATAIGTWMQSNSAVADATAANQPGRTAELSDTSADRKSASATATPPAATASIASSGPVTAMVPPTRSEERRAGNTHR